MYNTALQVLWVLKVFMVKKTFIWLKGWLVVWILCFHKSNVCGLRINAPYPFPQVI